MKKIRCAVIDDEALARKYMKDYVSKVPFLELVGDYNSPLKVMPLIQDGKVDLLFLDIQMPDISGLDFLKSLDRKPYVVFTTAYREYALEGYDLDVVDYLLKPISFDRFLKATNKVHAKIQDKTSDQPAPLDDSNYHANFIIIRADRKHYKINYDDLIFIEGQRSYVTFHTSSKRITALASLKDLEEKLPENQFLRIHKSYIVSKKQIDALEGNQIEIGGKKIPIGKSYKADVVKLFGIEGD